MADMSDEELEGDVDMVDFDFDDKPAKTDRKYTVVDKPDVKKKEQASVHKQKRKDDGSRTMKTNPASVTTVKQPVKRKAPIVPAVGDDLLQAFSIGGPSIKKGSQVETKKRKQEPVIVKSSSSQQEEKKKSENVAATKMNVVKEAVKAENIKSESSSAIKEKSTNVFNVTEVKVEKKDISPEKVGKSEGKEKDKISTKNEVEKVAMKLEIKVELENDIQQNVYSTSTELKNVIHSKETPQKSSEEDKVTMIDSSKKPSTPLNKETSGILKKEVDNEAKVTSQRETFKAKSLTKDSSKAVPPKDIKEIPSNPLKKEIHHKTNETAKEIPKDKSATKESASKIVTPKVMKETPSESMKKKVPETNETTSLKEPNKDKSLNDKPSKTATAKTTQKTPSESLKSRKDEIKKGPQKENVDGSDKTNTSVSKDQRKSETKIDTGNKDYEFSEEDYKNIDINLADQMLERTKLKVLSRPDVKYTVKVAPLEIADLAQPSLQQIIQLHPSTTLFFKHQAVKFRKKKGFAEATFSTMTELKEFVYQLTQLKLFEKKIEVIISSLTSSLKPDVLSFTIHLDHNAKLLKLIDSGEDPMINKPAAAGLDAPKIEFERVPCTSNGAFMHSMFPFTYNVIITKSWVGSKPKNLFQGPVSVFYINDKWLEAVMECCTDFKVNEFPLLVKSSSIPDCLKKTKGDSESKMEDKLESSQGHKDTESADEDEDDSDDPVANMTRDVCADMLESIKKLKELESDNPNIKRILEMQAQLNELQKSLIKPKDRKSNNDEMEVDEGNENDDSKSAHDEKSKKQTCDLEEMFEEADRAERQREEQLRQQREMEIQKRKEFEIKKKSQWAKRTLLDYKQVAPRGEKMSEEAEKILRQREQRIREREEEEKRKKIKDEEERLRLLQEKEDAERKDAERKRLIQKIEEARLRDSQKADKISSSQLMWNASSDEGATSRKVLESGSRKNKETDSRPKRKEDSSSVDQGMDARLASFERELAQQGKIDRRKASALARPDRPHNTRSKTQNSPVLSEDEYQDLLANNQVHTLSPNYKVKISRMINRFCPVSSCPAKVCFRDSNAFLEHWSIFHKPEQTMRFCPKCSAYFMNLEELENHMMKHHRLHSQEAEHLALTSRVKVIPNPSFRDPSPFLPPVSS